MTFFSDVEALKEMVWWRENVDTTYTWLTRGDFAMGQRTMRVGRRIGTFAEGMCSSSVGASRIVVTWKVK